MALDLTKRGQLMTEGFEKTLREIFFFVFKKCFQSIMAENSLCLSLNPSANASNSDLPTILSFGRVEKLLEKKKLNLLVMCNFALTHYLSGRPCEIMIVLSESRRGLFKSIC